MEVMIVGGGICGLTLALSLHELGIACRIFEAAPEIKPLGVGINLLPHGVKELSELGLQDALARVSVTTREMCYYNRFGQFIYKEPRGQFAGYEWPQFSIHRAALHNVLLEAVHARLGKDAILLGHKCVGVEQDETSATASFVDSRTGATLGSHNGSAVAGCDGIHSAVRKQLYPDEGALCFQGINMWRGVTRWKPYLTGESMILAGWLEVGKMVIYPIQNNVDGEGRQLISWIAEIQSPHRPMLDWNLEGKLEEFHPIFADWTFPWLDVSALISNAETILEYPMVDRNPLPQWSQGHITLLGDAAHPMYPRGANGAAHAILDARALARALKQEGEPVAALKAYEDARLKAANAVVLANRTAPSDYLLKVAHERSQGKRFERIEDIISHEELAAMSESYKRVAGFDKGTLRSKRAAPN